MGQEQHRATARVLDIVESLSEVQEGLTLTELAVALKAPKSSLFPIVHTLEQRKYIMCDAGSGKYRLGLRTYIIGASCTSQSGFEPLINIMNSVTESTQETSQFGILEGGNVLYVAKKDSPQAIRMISWVGTKLPANATAIGKALLSDLQMNRLEICIEMACQSLRNIRFQIWIYCLVRLNRYDAEK